MLNRSASLAMSTSVLKALPGKFDIKRHSPIILYVPHQTQDNILENDKKHKKANNTLVNVNAPVVATTSWWLHFSAPVVA